MKTNELLFIFAVIAVLIVLIHIFVTFIKISDFEEELTGKVSGYVNLTVTTSISVNLSRSSLNWSSGVVTAGQTNATLYTQGDSDGSVTRGNWSGTGVKGFIVENTGAINVSLFLKSGKNADDFFGSLSSSNQEYKFNVSNKDDSSCSGGAALGQWADVNKTSGGTKYCSQFDFNSAHDEIYIDVWLTIPYDAGNTGAQTDTITITANTAG